jgi:hypothetical protein
MSACGDRPGRTPRHSTVRWRRGLSHSTAVTLLPCVGEAPEGCYSEDLVRRLHWA